MTKDEAFDRLKTQILFALQDMDNLTAYEHYKFDSPIDVIFDGGTDADNYLFQIEIKFK